MEAVWRIEVEDFPAFIVVDDKGNDFLLRLHRRRKAQSPPLAFSRRRWFPAVSSGGAPLPYHRIVISARAWRFGLGLLWLGCLTSGGCGDSEETNPSVGGGGATNSAGSGSVGGAGGRGGEGGVDNDCGPIAIPPGGRVRRCAAAATGPSVEFSAVASTTSASTKTWCAPRVSTATSGAPARKPAPAPPCTVPTTTSARCIATWKTVSSAMGSRFCAATPEYASCVATTSPVTTSPCSVAQARAPPHAKKMCQRWTAPTPAAAPHVDRPLKPEHRDR